MDNFGADHHFNGGQQVTATTTVISMINGMLGGSALVLPLVGLQAGWFTSIWTCIMVGFLLYYTASLIVAHLGKSANIKYSILAHFDNNYKYVAAYGVIIWISFIPFIVMAFIIICQEVTALFGYSSVYITISVFILVVLGTIVSRVMHWAQQIMALGIVGSSLYIIFLVWALVSAPQGQNTVPTQGSPFNIIATLVTSFQIHDFLAQNIIKNPRKHEYQSVVRATFFFGAVIYIFSLLGSFAIVNRISSVSNPQLISDYFQTGLWQVTILQVSFIVVIFAGLPNFIIVSKVRFFQIFKVDLGEKILHHEIIYIFVIVSFAVMVYALGINLQTIFVINGTIIGYLYVFVVPIWMHFKCVWVDRSSGTIEGDQEWNYGVKSNICECETVFLVFLLVAGVGLIYFNLTNLPQPSHSSQH